MKNEQRIYTAAVAWGIVPKSARRNGPVHSAGLVQRTALTGLMLLAACGCATALPGPRFAAEELPLLPPLPLPATAEPVTTAPATVQQTSGASSANRESTATDQRFQDGPKQDGSPLHEPDQRGQRAPADVRMAVLEGQLQWLRGDIARLQQLLNNQATGAVAATGGSGVSAVRPQSLPQHADDSRSALDGTSPSDHDQQSTIDALNRRVATLEAMFVKQQTTEVRALDDVIAGMEQLLQLQAKQMIRTSHAGQER